MKRQIYSHENKTPTLRNYVYSIANEVLNVLKEMARENNNQLSVDLLAKEILSNNTITQILEKKTGNELKVVHKDATAVQETADTIIRKLSEVIPESIIHEHNKLKQQLFDASVIDSPVILLEVTIEIVKKYFRVLGHQHAELVDFMKQAILYADKIEKHMKFDQLAKNSQYNENRNFEDSISSNINKIKYDISTSADLYDLKRSVLDKLEHISLSVKEKREQDILRFKENETHLDEMRRRMKEMKAEASEMRKKAEEMEFENVRDVLTGLYNRKAFDRKMDETLTDLKRYNRVSTLMICDIDSFKTINETFGHKVGDLALKKLSSLLMIKTRNDDFISRYGGEEFTIIFPGTNVDDAKKVAEEIRALISNSEFCYKGKTVPFSISIGLSEFRKTDDSSSVFDRADKALYHAKVSGKNMVKTENELNEISPGMNQHSLK